MHSPLPKPAKQPRVIDKAPDAPGARSHYAQKTARQDGLRSFFHAMVDVPGSSEHLLIL